MREDLTLKELQVDYLLHRFDTGGNLCYTLSYKVRRLFNMLSEEELQCRLSSDLQKLKLPVDEFDIVVRPYSKSFYGRYFPEYGGKVAEVRVYPYQYKKFKVMFPYSTVLYHTIHEVCHHIQYTDPNYVRKKGVMHDPQFFSLLERYVNRAVDLGLLSMKEVISA